MPGKKKKTATKRSKKSIEKVEDTESMPNNIVELEVSWSRTTEVWTKFILLFFTFFSPFMITALFLWMFPPSILRSMDPQSMTFQFFRIFFDLVVIVISILCFKLILEKSYCEFNLCLLPNINDKNNGNYIFKPLDTTWGKATRVWWRYIWLSFAYSLPVIILIIATWAYFTSSLKSKGSENQTFIHLNIAAVGISIIAGIFISLYTMKSLLKKKFKDFHIALIENESYSKSSDISLKQALTSDLSIKKIDYRVLLFSIYIFIAYMFLTYHIIICILYFNSQYTSINFFIKEHKYVESLLYDIMTSINSLLSYFITGYIIAYLTKYSKLRNALYFSAFLIVLSIIEELFSKTMNMSLIRHIADDYVLPLTVVPAGAFLRVYVIRKKASKPFLLAKA